MTVVMVVAGEVAAAVWMALIISILGIMAEMILISRPHPNASFLAFVGGKFSFHIVLRIAGCQSLAYFVCCGSDNGNFVFMNFDAFFSQLFYQGFEDSFFKVCFCLD